MLISLYISCWFGTQIHRSNERGAGTLINFPSHQICFDRNVGLNKVQTEGGAASAGLMVSSCHCGSSSTSPRPPDLLHTLTPTLHIQRTETSIHADVCTISKITACVYIRNSGISLEFLPKSSGQLHKDVQSQSDVLKLIRGAAVCGGLVFG